MTGSFGEGYTIKNTREVGTQENSKIRQLVEQLQKQTGLSHKIISKIVDLLVNVDETSKSVFIDNIKGKASLIIHCNTCVINFTPETNNRVHLRITAANYRKLIDFDFDIESALLLQYVARAYSLIADKLICSQLFTQTEQN